MLYCICAQAVHTDGELPYSSHVSLGRQTLLVGVNDLLNLSLAFHGKEKMAVSKAVSIQLPHAIRHIKGDRIKDQAAVLPLLQHGEGNTASVG